VCTVSWALSCVSGCRAIAACLLTCLHVPGLAAAAAAEEEAVDLVFARGTIQSIHDKQIEIKRAVPRDSMPPSPRTLQHRPPMVHNMIQSAYDHPPPDMWQQQQRAVLPPHYGGGGGGGGGGGRGGRVSSGGGGYSPSSVPSYGGYRGQYTPAGAGMSPHHSYGSGPRGAGMRSPPHRGVHHHHMGGGGPQPPFTPPAVVTGAGCSRAVALPCLSCHVRQACLSRHPVPVAHWA
jgi:hypothetical protein